VHLTVPLGLKEAYSGNKTDDFSPIQIARLGPSNGEVQMLMVGALYKSHPSRHMSLIRAVEQSQLAAAQYAFALKLSWWLHTASTGRVLVSHS